MTRLRPWQIWVIAGFCSVVLIAAGAVEATTDPSLHMPQLNANEIEWGSTYIAFLLLGALICTRRPGNVVGPLFVAGGVLNTVVWGAGEYAVWALVRHPGSLPAGGFAAWLSVLFWSAAIGMLMLATSVFPTGRLPSRRWRWLPWTLCSAITVIVVASAIDLWPLRGAGLLRQDVNAAQGTAATRIIGVVYPVALLCGLAAMVSIVVRYRRARDIERLQLKWLVVAVFVAAPALVVNEFTPLGSNGVVQVVAGVLDAPVWFAVSATLAILRYRLFDIDRILSRTVSYGVVTGLLVVVYVGCVALTTRVLPLSSSFAVAASTLAAAAAFQPVRGSVQTAVDRRFNRARYDAARTVDAFSARLRSEVAIPTISADLVDVVRRTVAPSSTSLWLRGVS